MGKRNPTPPTPPDPVKTAQAQGAINKETALTQQKINMVNEYSPYGSSEYTKRGTPGADGVQQYSRTTTLDPAQQAIVDKQNAVTNSLNEVAQQQVGRVGEALKDPFSYDGVPAAGDTSGARRAAEETSRLAGQQVSYAGQPAAPTAGGINDAANVAASSVSSPFNLQGSGPSAAGISGAADRAEAGMAQPFNYEGLSAAANTRGAENAVQTATDAYGNPLNYAGAPAAPEADSAARQQVIDSVYNQQASRLDPRFAGEQRAMETKLANSGIARGTEAFSGAMDDFNRGRNDAYQGAQNAAIQAGGREQSRLFGLGTSARQNAISEQNYLRDSAGREQGQLLGYQSQLSGLQNDARGRGAQERMTQRGMGIDDAKTLQQLRRQEFDASGSERDRSVQDQLLQRGMPLQEQQQIQQMRGTAYDAQGQDRSRGIQEQMNIRNANIQGQQQAYNTQQGLFGLDQAARQRGIEESAYLRNMPLNETSALMSGNQINNPQFGAYSPSAVANTDYAGIVNNNYNAQVNAANAAAGSRNAKTGAMAGIAGAAITAF